MKTLETERLILRPFIESDFEAVHAYASVPENMQYAKAWCKVYPQSSPTRMA